MTEKLTSRFPFQELKDLPEDIYERITAVQEKSGFVPNVYLVLAQRPDEFRAFFAYHDALMNKDDGLTKGEREMIVVTTSGLNNCTYCVVAHGAILRIREKNPIIADQLATNYHNADITSKQKVMLDFAVKVSLNSKEIDNSDFEKMRTYGFSDNEIWQTASISAFFALSNRIANFSSIKPNEEFYILGRTIRK